MAGDRGEAVAASVSERDGRVWTVYVEYDGAGDTLCLGRGEGTGVQVVARLSRPGVIPQPAIATGPGLTEAFWPIPRPYQVIGSTNPVWIDIEESR